MELMLSGMSLINIKKRMCHNTEPWGQGGGGTPNNIEAGSEQTPSMTTFCVRPDSQAVTISDTIILQLILQSLMLHIIESLGKVHNNEICL